MLFFLHSEWKRKNPTKEITFRLSEMDRDTMERAAKAMELSVAEYLLRLHYHAFEAFKAEGIVE